MAKHPAGRRAFLQSFLVPPLAGFAPHATAADAGSKPAPPPESAGPPRIKFAVIGVNHAHVHRQVDALTKGGAELALFFAKEPDLADAFAKRYPKARLARSEKEIFESDVQLVSSAAIPSERADLAIAAMRHGKDFLADKPGMTTLAQLAAVRRVQAETKRIYSILYSERHENRSTVKAAELCAAGAIGQVVQTVGLGPHRLNAKTRPAWFFQRAKVGGILTDVGSHQFDQFLVFTGSTKAEIVTAQVGNTCHPEHPEFEDFGDVLLRGDRGTGYVRVDYLTPDGLSTWGDTRLTIIGSEGYIEVRKNVDVAGRPGGEHLFLVDKKSATYFDCKTHPLPFGGRLVDDVLNRTETAMPQAHTFYAMELALKAQKQARRLRPTKG